MTSPPIKAMDTQATMKLPIINEIARDKQPIMREITPTKVELLLSRDSAFVTPKNHKIVMETPMVAPKRPVGRRLVALESPNGITIRMPRNCPAT